MTLERGAGLHHTIHRADDPSASWVVLSHGAGLNAEIWAPQIEAFSRAHHLLIPDLRGHGASPALKDRATPYRWDGVARDVLDLLDQLGIEAAHFVGISLGCIVARTAAEVAPDRVRSLVLAGAIARLNPGARVLIRLAHAMKRSVPYMWLYRTYARILMPRPGHRDSRREVRRQARRLGGQHEFGRWLDLTHPLPDLLRRFREHDPGIPTLYVSGDQDHMFLPGIRDLAASHASASLEVIPNCGHLCTWQEADAFNAAALRFLDAALSRTRAPMPDPPRQGTDSPPGRSASTRGSRRP